MAAANEQGNEEGIRSFSMVRPGGQGELEIIFESGQYRRVDAVFTSVNAVETILIPFYQERSAKEADELREALEAQQSDNVCMVLHMRTCSFRVPDIDWEGPSTIHL
jgi:DNA-binding LytR/AlgR family response regulator